MQLKFYEWMSENGNTMQLWLDSIRYMPNDEHITHTNNKCIYIYIVHIPKIQSISYATSNKRNARVQ